MKTNKFKLYSSVTVCSCVRHYHSFINDAMIMLTFYLVYDTAGRWRNTQTANQMTALKSHEGKFLMENLVYLTLHKQKYIKMFEHFVFITFHSSSTEKCLLLSVSQIQIKDLLGLFFLSLHATRNYLGTHFNEKFRIRHF